MKTLKNSLKLAMIAMVVIFTSCSKDDSISEDTQGMEEVTNHELLMTGKWYIHSTTGGGSTNECERQSYFQFIDEDTLIVQIFEIGGGDLCYAQAVQNITYEMTSEDTFIQVEEPAYYFIIEMVSETELVLRQTDGVDSYVISFQK